MSAIVEADIQRLVDLANAGVQEALQQLLKPVGRPGRIMPTWEACTRYPDGYRLGRNDLPVALYAAFEAGVLQDPGEVAKGVAEAWVMCEYPLLTLPSFDWEEMFAYTGFVSDTGFSGHGQERPAPPVLYRSAHPDYLTGMSWTTSLETAYWFACRNRRAGHIEPDGVAVVKVETANCPWWEPLGTFTGRDENEWVMPYSEEGLPWEALGFDELDRLSVEWQRAEP